MKLLFRATPEKRTHLGQGIRAQNGNIVEVDQKRGKILLDAYPSNFLSIPFSVMKLGEPVHAPIKLSDITVLVVNAYPDVLQKCLLPCLPEEVEFIELDNVDNKNWKSGAKALNYGIKKARNDIVICAHVDLVLGRDWFGKFIYQECRLKNWGCLGIVGSGIDGNGRQTTLWGADRTGPYPVEALDECCLIVNKKNGLWFDEKMLGDTWHCYGIDFCYQCHNKGLGVYILAGISDHAQGGTSLHKIQGWMGDRNKIIGRLKKKWRDKFSTIHFT